MTKVRRTWDVLQDERHAQLVQEIIAFYKEQHGEDIGIVAAEKLLDFFLERLHPDIRNTTLDDVKRTVQQASEDLDIALDLLKIHEK